MMLPMMPLGVQAEEKLEAMRQRQTIERGEVCPVAVQMWQGCAQSRRRCGRGEPSSRRRCGSGEPGRGADAFKGGGARAPQGDGPRARARGIHKKQAALKDDRRRSEKQAQVHEVEQGFMQV
jgi:hypothetical protein